MIFFNNGKSVDMSEIALKIATIITCFHSLYFTLSGKGFDFALLLTWALFSLKTQK